jgi:hypothetical protein
MLNAFYNEQAVKVGDDTLRLVINFAAIDAAEGMIGRDFDQILAELTSQDPKPGLALQGKVVWALLREHHPDVSIDQVATLLFGPASTVLGMAIGKLLTAAFPSARGAAKPANPRKPRGASKPSSSPGAKKA